MLVGGRDLFCSLMLFVELLSEEASDDLTSSYCPSSYPELPSGINWSSFLYSAVKNFVRYRLYMFLSFSYIVFITLQ
jgi:hypothetical protein